MVKFYKDICKGKSRTSGIFYGNRFHKFFNHESHQKCLFKEVAVLHEIEEVIRLIKDGQWHTLEAIMRQSKLPKFKTSKILEFLANYDFIDLNSKHQKAKATPSLEKFLKENQTY